MLKVWYQLGCFIVLVFFSLVLADLNGLAETSTQQSQSAHPSGDSPASLADIVRGSRAQKNVSARNVLTDEDMEVSAGPLPRLTMDGAENADEVVAAISAYKAKRTPEETEKAVRIWYERYDEMLAAAIQENLDLKTRRDENLNNGYELCQRSQDYEHCQNRRMAEARGARHDQAEMAQNSNLMFGFSVPSPRCGSAAQKH